MERRLHARSALLAKAPFNLDAEASPGCGRAFGRLSPDEKVRQLFNLRSAGNDRGDARGAAGVPARRHHPPVPARTARRSGRSSPSFNRQAPVPLLVSADLEGSRMSLPGGTEFPNPLALAAIDDVEATTAHQHGMAREAHAVGINWCFTPVLDINATFKSAIVATRGFGSDMATIERHALAQLRAFQDNGVAAAVKHWPGEGFDDRDQHLVTTVNPLSHGGVGGQFRPAVPRGHRGGRDERHGGPYRAARLHPRHQPRCRASRPTGRPR